MTRSSNAQRAHLLNSAFRLVKKHDSPAGAAAELAKRHGISVRQAYRYVEEARAMRDPIAVPEAKIAFTVKLPRDVVEATRKKATSTGQSLGALVTQALELFLKVRRRGQ